MNKNEFLADLKGRLEALSADEVQSRIDYYSEIIDDRAEELGSEEAAVAALGSIDDIVNEILLDAPLATLVKSRVMPSRKLSGVEIALLIIGFPIWFPLTIAFAAILIAVYVSIWAIIISLYAAVAALLLGGICATVVGSVSWITNPISALFLTGAGLVCIGIAIFALAGRAMLSGSLIKLTVSFVRLVKKLFIRKPQEKQPQT